MLHRFVIMVSRRIKILTIFVYDTIMHLIQFQLKMKVFKIPSGGFTVTKTTNLRFTVQIKKEAEGHAICIDEDKNVDPFGGLKMRCVVISGTQFAQWKTAKKHNLAFNKEVTMKGGSSGSLLYAVDGNINTQSNTLTSQGTPWLKVNLQQTYIITDITIHAGKDKQGQLDTRWTGLIVKILDASGNQMWQQAGLVTSLTMAEHLKITNIVDSSGNPIEGSQVRVELTSATAAIFRVAEIEVFGKPLIGQDIVLDVPVGDLFLSSASPTTDINYIAVVQDNDSVPLYGESTLSNIELYERAPPVSLVRCSNSSTC